MVLTTHTEMTSRGLASSMGLFLPPISVLANDLHWPSTTFGSISESSITVVEAKEGTLNCLFPSVRSSLMSSVAYRCLLAPRYLPVSTTAY